VAHLVYRAAARRDLADIAAYIEDESQSRDVADSFIGELMDYCEHIAKLPFAMGRARSDLGRGFRSVTFGRYVIFFEYGESDVSREYMFVTNVVHGSRDMDAYFGQGDDHDPVA
jgi:toxin ParE1/3/4